jgi:hypothetical protein
MMSEKHIKMINVPLILAVIDGFLMKTLITVRIKRMRKINILMNARGLGGNLITPELG